MKKRLAALALLLAMSPFASAEDPPVTILAASSLQDVFTELEPLLEKAVELPIRMAFDGTGVLARQLDQGAPADLFVSASKEWTDRLVEKRLMDGDDRRVIAGNRLVFIQPAPHDVFVQEPADLARLNHIALGDPATVPAGRYARQYLEKQGLWDALQESIGFAGNVRAVLALVERGEVGGGFVFATDARAVTSEPGIRIALTVDPSQHDPIVYEAAVPARAPRRVSGLKLLWALATPEAKAVFEKHGFTLP